MKWATFDICPVLFNGVNNGYSSLRWLMDLAICAAKEIVYLFLPRPYLFHLCKIKIRGKAFSISIVFQPFKVI